MDTCPRGAVLPLRCFQVGLRTIGQERPAIAAAWAAFGLALGGGKQPASLPRFGPLELPRPRRARKFTKYVSIKTRSGLQSCRCVHSRTVCPFLLGLRKEEISLARWK